MKDQFRTRPRTLDPETEAVDELCKHYRAESFDHKKRGPVGHSPFYRKKETSKWAINPEWIKLAGEIIHSTPPFGSTVAENKQCAHDKVYWVVMFLVELNEWCRLNELALPENCDPSKWDAIPAALREAIVEELALRTLGAPFDPFDL